jgi:putative tricarboxylic transport membrane protein
MITLGVPGSIATANIMGALLMFVMTPDRFFFTKKPEFVWV